MDEFKEKYFDAHCPEKCFDKFPDSDLVERILETVPVFRISFENCRNMRCTVEIKGLNYDMQEEQFMNRFGRFKGCPCAWGRNGIVGLQFIYQEQYRMYTSGRQAHEAPPMGVGEVLVFFGKVFVCFLSEHLADLFQAQFDGWYGGDLKQYEKFKYTHVSGDVQETYKPDYRHRAQVGGGLGTARFDEDVWRCMEPVTQKSRAFEPEWEELDRRMDAAGSEYWQP